MDTNATTGLERPERLDEPADLTELIDLHESTDWSDVPGISTAEARAWTARLVEANGVRE